jgi:hypothetical protein
MCAKTKISLQRNIPASSIDGEDDAALGRYLLLLLLNLSSVPFFDNKKEIW